MLFFSILRKILAEEHYMLCTTCSELNLQSMLTLMYSLHVVRLGRYNKVHFLSKGFLVSDLVFSCHIEKFFW